MRNTRVKVKREFLIEKIKEELAKAEAMYEAEMKTFGTAIVAQSKAVAAELRTIAEKIDKDPKNTEIYGIERLWLATRISVPLKTRVTVATPDDREIKRLKKTIRVLEAATDDTISVSSMDDYYQFL